jgi:hypothetical protein
MTEDQIPPDRVRDGRGAGADEGNRTSGAEDGVKDALEFARQLAREEIESIERIHGRTLKSFAYIGVAVATAAAIFGYFGYANLRNTAITTAENQMRAEVTKQVREKLTQENVESIVQEQVRNYSATEMSEAIHNALRAPAESAIIRAAAADEARNQIKEQFSPRHFTEAQSKAFIKAVNDQPDLEGYPVNVLPMTLNSEAETYASEIRASVAQTKLKVVPSFGGFDKSAVAGVAIYRDQTSPEIFARRLQEAFSQCGIDAQIVNAPPPMPTLPAGQKAPMLIFVGPRHM